MVQVSITQGLLRKHHPSLFAFCIGLRCLDWGLEIMHCIQSRSPILSEEIYVFKTFFFQFSQQLLQQKSFFSILICVNNHRSTVSQLTTAQFIKQKRRRREQYSNERRRRRPHIRESKRIISLYTEGISKLQNLMNCRGIISLSPSFCSKRSSELKC